MLKDQHTQKEDLFEKYIQALVGVFSYSVLLDRDKKILYFSDSLYSLLGIEDHNIFTGMSVYDVYKSLNDKEIVEKSSRRFSRILSGENEFIEEDTITWPTGIKRIYRIAFRRIADKKNDFAGLVIVAQDITYLRLEEAERRMNDMLNSIMLPCVVWDMKGNFIAYNDEAFHVFGNTRITSLKDFSEHFFSIAPKKQPNGKKTESLRQSVIRESLKKGFAQTRVLLSKNDGTPTYFMISIYRISWVFNYRLVVNFHDMTSLIKKEAEAKEAEQRIRLMLDTNPMMCILQDDRNNIIDCNQATLNILEFSNKAEFCKQFYNLFPEFQPNGIKTTNMKAEVHRILDETETDSITIERSFKKLSGELIPVESKIVRIPWKNSYYYLSFSLDLREKKANEQKILEIAEREREAVLQREAAQAGSEAKSQFLANMSHEIRTPMNAVLGMSDLLLQENLTHRQLQYVKDINVSAAILLDIINDILDVSKWQTGKLSLVPVHYYFSEFIDKVNSVAKFLIEDKNIVFDMIIQENAPVCLYGDDVRLRQVLLNLLSNAGKFTNEGSIQLKVTFTDNSIKITVSDTGIGIHPKAIAILFDAFEQADVKRNRNITGTGLGLTIAKAIVEMMGGQITVESVYGQGTSFHVEIPKILGNEALIHHVDNHEIVLYAPDAKVLVVDDNKINLDVACGLLQLCQVTTDTALSGKQAIDLLQQNTYDMVFMDQMMPKMTGIEATKIIRGMGITTPIIALTASAVTGAKEMMLNAGMDGYLSKPVSMIDFKRTLKQWIPAEKFLNPPPVTTIPVEVKDEKFWNKIEQIQELSVSEWMSRFDNQKDLYEKMLRLMIQEIEKCNKNLPEFLLANDMNSFRIEVHSMKGALASIGAMSISAKALDLEVASSNMEIDFCVSHLPVLLERLCNLSLNLKDAFSVKDQNNDPVEIPPELPLIFERMINAFEEIDLLLINKEIENLNELKLSSALKEKVEQIKHMVIMMDYDKAKKKIHDLNCKMPSNNNA
ncbi:MAG: response regulator [Azoarcus sp.]|jgi:PAS domain S-box-containing protein|nr:response regulator [Azoarcus sp.]